MNPACQYTSRGSISKSCRRNTCARGFNNSLPISRVKYDWEVSCCRGVPNTSPVPNSMSTRGLQIVLGTFWNINVLQLLTKPMPGPAGLQTCTSVSPGHRHDATRDSQSHNGERGSQSQQEENPSWRQPAETEEVAQEQRDVREQKGTCQGTQEHGTREHGGDPGQGAQFEPNGTSNGVTTQNVTPGLAKNTKLHTQRIHLVRCRSLVKRLSVHSCIMTTWENSFVAHSAYKAMMGSLNP